MSLGQTEVQRGFQPERFFRKPNDKQQAEKLTSPLTNCHILTLGHRQNRGRGQ